MPEAHVISADSHTLEPADLWTTRIDRRFRDRAPHVLDEYDGRPGAWFVCEELAPRAVGALAAAGTDPLGREQKIREGYASMPPAGWDPIARLEDQDTDGVHAEVLYSTLGMGLFQLKDDPLRSAAFRAYNDWLAEYCAAAPTRLYGIALVNLGDIDEAVRELDRAKNLGLRGAMIWASPPAARPYSLPLYEPFWTVAEELDMPLSMHSLTGADGTGLGPASAVLAAGVNHKIADYTLLFTMVCRSITALIVGGVLERHPGLKVVSVENDTGWLATYLTRLDHAGANFYRFKDPCVKDPASQYFRRQVSATFQDDRAGILVRELIGVENLMWGSDFPHGDSTWPHSRAVLDRNFAGVAEEDRRKITSENVQRLYRLPGWR